jgi:hypothetical protein
MARAKVIKKQNRCFIELPESFLSSEEVELFALRDGYYLLSMPLSSVPAQPQSSAAPTPAEIAVLHKLQAIKFGDRTPENVSRILSDNEKETLRMLEKKGLVNLFKGNKYKDGVYNIDDNVYPILKNTNEQKPRETSAVADPIHQALAKQGFIVIKDQREARELSERLKSEMKSGSVVGTKGFDGSFYVVTRDYFSKASKLILGALEKEADVLTIAATCKLDADGVRTVLQHLAESGEIIEKRKGTFAAV